MDDFLESLIDGKLFKQMAQLRDAYSRPVLILEGDNLLTKRNINHNAIFGSLASITVDFGIPILSTKDARETADLLNVIAKREQREDKKEGASAFSPGVGKNISSEITKLLNANYLED